MTGPNEHPLARADRQVIQVTGDDAQAFLQAQLSCDLREMQPSDTAYGAWLDPQGRVRACLDLLMTDTGIDLLVNDSLAESVTAGLSRYILRSKVQISQRSEWTVGAQLGASPDGSSANTISISPTLAYRFPVDAIETDSSNAARLAATLLGRPELGPETSGSFTAHMINLDQLGALSFTKGCYPGQEVVARTENLGKAKRRMFGFTTTSSSLPADGSPVMDPSGREHGLVLQAARDENCIVLLAVIRLDSINEPLYLEHGADALTRKPVPGEIAL